MQKEITIATFTDELIRRIDEAKTIDCCVDEIKRLASLAKEEMPDKMIMVEWKD